MLTLPLTGEWVQGAGFGANGITRTPEGKALLVVNSTSGLLSRVDPATGVATVVDLGEALLTNGDGLLLRGRTLYAVQNRDNRIAVVRLDPAGNGGTVRRYITSDEFDAPTTFSAKLYGQRRADARLAFARRAGQPSGGLLKINRRIGSQARLTQTRPRALSIKACSGKFGV